MLENQEFYKLVRAPIGLLVGFFTRRLVSTSDGGKTAESNHGLRSGREKKTCSLYDFIDRIENQNPKNRQQMGLSEQSRRIDSRDPTLTLQH